MAAIKGFMLRYRMELFFQTILVALKRFLIHRLRGCYFPASILRTGNQFDQEDTNALKAISSRRTGKESVILIYNSQFNIPMRDWFPLIPDGFEFTVDRRRMTQAAAVLFHLPTLGYIGNLKKSPGQLWIGWTMECEAHFPHLENSHFMGQFDLMMSHHQDADIYLPYMLPTYKACFKEAPKPKKEGHLVSFFASNYNERSGRNRYVFELLKYLDVHCYGKCFRNRRLPADQDNVRGKLDTLSSYKFDLAFENAIGVDYVTEKFFHPLLAGCVPVYLGAPNVDEYAPGDHCFINTADFKSPKALAEYLLWLDADEAAYRAYFDWKEQPIRRTFMDDEFEKSHPFVRLCWKIKEMHP
ncbi:MAG: hypothetical protein JXA42_17525 [Anaerolineales bacterium]|nr:hypothetical protein [Anaerolineales bacterium]